MNLELLAALVAAAREKAQQDADEKTAAVDVMLARQGYREPTAPDRLARLAERLKIDDSRREAAKDLAYAVDRSIKVTATDHIAVHYSPEMLVQNEHGEFVRIPGEVDIVIHRPGEAVSFIGRKVVKGLLQDLMANGLIS